ncbi:unnamed protein product [Lactuca saligna]|uniref:Uncharacterized protein n=1 Tax=Lactuca saligna TaxID=75948 RepID=A0AA35V0B2_LACSI|nr:unnamed protein product [Lactuca saligna]
MVLVFAGIEANISLEMAPCDHYQGNLCHQEVDLVEALPLLYMKNFAFHLTLLLICPWGCKRGKVLPSDEETEFNDVSLRPRKIHKTVYVHLLLGGIGDVTGDKFVLPGQKKITLVPSSLKASPSPFIGSFSVDPGSSSMLRGCTRHIRRFFPIGQAFHG